MSETLTKLKDEIDSEIRDNAEELYEDRDASDRFHEMADSSVPVYNSDLADVLASDPEVAYMDDPGLAEGCDDIYRRIAISIYEKLVQQAYETWDTVKEEIDDRLEEIEDVTWDDLESDDVGYTTRSFGTDEEKEIANMDLGVAESIDHPEHGLIDEDEITDRQEEILIKYREQLIKDFWEEWSK